MQNGSRRSRYKAAGVYCAAAAGPGVGAGAAAAAAAACCRFKAASSMSWRSGLAPRVPPPRLPPSVCPVLAGLPLPVLPPGTTELKPAEEPLPVGLRRLAPVPRPGKTW
jgi:hypothetical protein